MTIDELLLENRIVFLIGEINHASAARVMMQMLYLENQKKGQEINFYINSPGGSVDDTLALYDTMRFLSSPVSTYCIGRAYSGGACCSPRGEGQAVHPAPRQGDDPPALRRRDRPGRGHPIQAEQIIKAKKTLNEILAEHTGQTVRHGRRRTASATSTSAPTRPRSTASSTRSQAADGRPARRPADPASANIPHTNAGRPP
jgi:ATP-dependent Clp protease protease subunit